MADADRPDDALEVLARLQPSPDAPLDGPAAVVEAAIALRQGELKHAAQCYAWAAEAYGGTHDPRDVMEALVGLIASAPDAQERAEAVGRLTALCRAGGITLLPRERALLGPEITAEVAGS
jgi:hypothetical protein